MGSRWMDRHTLLIGRRSQASWLLEFFCFWDGRNGVHRSSDVLPATAVCRRVRLWFLAFLRLHRFGGQALPSVAIDFCLPRLVLPVQKVPSPPCSWTAKVPSWNLTVELSMWGVDVRGALDGAVSRFLTSLSLEGQSQ